VTPQIDYLPQPHPFGCHEARRAARRASTDLGRSAGANASPVALDTGRRGLSRGTIMEAMPQLPSTRASRPESRGGDNTTWPVAQFLKKLRAGDNICVPIHPEVVMTRRRNKTLAFAHCRPLAGRRPAFSLGQVQSAGRVPADRPGWPSSSLSRFASAAESAVLQPAPERNGRAAILSGAGTQFFNQVCGKRMATVRVVGKHSSR